MASQYWDSARNVQTMAESIDYLLYVDGKTSPKVKQYKSHTEEEYRKFLDSLRERLWMEHHTMMEDMGWE